MATSSATPSGRSPSRAVPSTKQEPAIRPSISATMLNEPSEICSRLARISRAQAFTGRWARRSRSINPAYAARQPSALISAIASASSGTASRISTALLRRLQVGSQLLGLAGVDLGRGVVGRGVVAEDRLDHGRHRARYVDLPR